MNAHKIIVNIEPPLTWYQSQALFHNQRYANIEASTKSGKTHACIVWLLKKACEGNAHQNFWWVSPVYPQSAIAFRRMRDAIPIAGRKANESDLTIILPNKAIIWFKSGEKPDNLYGEDVYAVVIDEASRMREEAWHAIRSTVTKTQGQVRIIGNVKGRKNWAYLLARRAQAGDPEMHYAKFTAYDAIKAGILKKEEVEDAKSVLPESVFKELYLAEPSDDEGNPFGLIHIHSCLAAVSNQEPVCFGIDLAKSVDYTVIIGLDQLGTVCRFERFQAPWRETLKKIRLIAGSVPALVDSTGVGDPILEELQRASDCGYGRFEGYKFTSESKQRLMEGLAVAIQQERIHFPDGPIRTELEVFEYEYTRSGVSYSAPEGCHDDCVCALALAVSQMMSHALRPFSAASSHNGLIRQRADWMGAREG